MNKVNVYHNTQEPLDGGGDISITTSEYGNFLDSCRTMDFLNFEELYDSVVG